MVFTAHNEEIPHHRRDQNQTMAKSYGLIKWRGRGVFPVREMVEAMGNRAFCLQQDGRQWAEPCLLGWAEGRWPIAFSLQLPVSHYALLEMLNAVVYSLQKQLGGSNKFGENYGERGSFCPHGRVQAPLPGEQIPPTEHTLELTFYRSQLCQCWWRSETHYRRVVCSTGLGKFTLIPVCSLNWRRMDRGSVGWYRSVDGRR